MAHSSPYESFAFDPILGEGRLQFARDHWAEIKPNGFPDNDDERGHVITFCHYDAHMGDDYEDFEAELSEFTVKDNVITLSIAPTYDLPGMKYVIDTAVKSYMFMETEPPMKPSPCEGCRAFESDGCPPMCSELTKKEDDAQ